MSIEQRLIAREVLSDPRSAIELGHPEVESLYSYLDGMDTDLATSVPELRHEVTSRVVTGEVQLAIDTALAGVIDSSKDTLKKVRQIADDFSNGLSITFSNRGGIPQIDKKLLVESFSPDGLRKPYNLIGMKAFNLMLNGLFPLGPNVPPDLAAQNIGRQSQIMEALTYESPVRFTPPPRKV